MLILKNQEINGILKSLSASEIHDYQGTLGEALALYSKDPSRLPHRTVFETDNSTHLFMPSVAGSNSALGIKVLTGTKDGFKGVTLCLDDNGNVSGILDAHAVTAFRTALATSIAWTYSLGADKLETIRTITVIGAGAQAYWHVRIALILIPSILHVNIWNRSASGAQNLLQDVQEGWPSVQFDATNDTSVLERMVKQSQLVFGCVPSTEPVLKGEWLQDVYFVSLIGSYKPHMRELSGSDVAKLHSSTGQNILVDSKDMTLKEAGELIDSGLGPRDLVEIGELVSGAPFHHQGCILYKCVGLSIMDISVSNKLQDTARRSKIGFEFSMD